MLGSQLGLKLVTLVQQQVVDQFLLRLVPQHRVDVRIEECSVSEESEDMQLVTTVLLELLEFLIVIQLVPSGQELPLL